MTQTNQAFELNEAEQVKPQAVPTKPANLKVVGDGENNDINRSFYF